MVDCLFWACCCSQPSKKCLCTANIRSWCLLHFHRQLWSPVFTKHGFVSKSGSVPYPKIQWFFIFIIIIIIIIIISCIEISMFPCWWVFTPFSVTPWEDSQSTATVQRLKRQGTWNLATCILLWGRVAHSAHAAPLLGRQHYDLWQRLMGKSWKK